MDRRYTPGIAATSQKDSISDPVYRPADAVNVSRSDQLARRFAIQHGLAAFIPPQTFIAAVYRLEQLGETLRGKFWI
jgi:hypothetical protein